MEQKLYTTREVAQHLRVSEEAVRQMVRAGYIRAHKLPGVAGSLRFTQEELDATLRPVGGRDGRK